MSDQHWVLEAIGLGKRYSEGPLEVEVLSSIDFAVADRKSTRLNSSHTS